MRAVYEGNGRGGIRTHGGFPHARFRVECLKPDSATLPRQKQNVEPAYAKGFGVASVQPPTSNVRRKYDRESPVYGETGGSSWTISAHSLRVAIYLPGACGSRKMLQF